VEKKRLKENERLHKRPKGGIKKSTPPVSGGMQLDESIQREKLLPGFQRQNDQGGEGGRNNHWKDAEWRRSTHAGTLDGPSRVSVMDMESSNGLMEG